MWKENKNEDGNDVNNMAVYHTQALPPSDSVSPERGSFISRADQTDVYQL